MIRVAQGRAGAEKSRNAALLQNSSGMFVAFRDRRLNFARLKAIVMPGEQPAARSDEKDNGAEKDDSPADSLRLKAMMIDGFVAPFAHLLRGRR